MVLVDRKTLFTLAVCPVSSVPPAKVSLHPIMFGEKLELSVLRTVGSQEGRLEASPAALTHPSPGTLLANNTLRSCLGLNQTGQTVLFDLFSGYFSERSLIVFIICIIKLWTKPLVHL